MTSSLVPQKEQRAGKSGRPSGRLLRRTFLIALLLVSGGLITGGAVELYFRYTESIESIRVLQQEIAQGAAFRIEQFVRDIEKTIQASTETQQIVSKGLTDAHRFELIKLLKFNPAIIQLSVLDSSGRERMVESRIKAVLTGDLRDRSSEDAFLEARRGKSYFGPVYFVRKSEPYMTIAVPMNSLVGEVIGVLAAEVNLSYVWDIVSGIKVGREGYAYAVSRKGDLIAHHDISLVLQRRNLARLGQVKAALSGLPGHLPTQSNLSGEEVFAAYALIPYLGWAVIVERPASEAYAPIYASLLRTFLLLLVALGVTGIATLLIMRRVIRPVQELQKGADSIGAGALDHRIKVETGDELEALAESFNRMAVNLRSARDELVRKTRLAAIGEMAAMVAHEIRNPLGALNNCVQPLRNNPYITGEDAELIEIIQSESQRLNHVVTDFLAFGRPRPPRFDEVNLNEVIEHTFVGLRDGQRPSSIRFLRRYDSSLPIIRADRDQLQQVFWNLYLNAVQAMGEKGEFSVETRRRGAHVEILVRDTGPGIPPAALQTIFEPFQSTKPHGTGLGLAIVRRIIEDHDGQITVNPSQEVGACFIITLPLGCTKG